MAFLFDALQKVRVVKFCQLLFSKEYPGHFRTFKHNETKMETALITHQKRE